MPRFLIDSHIFLWAIEEPALLTPQETAILTDGQTEVAVSAASLWELSIKAAKGKLAASDKTRAIPMGHFARAADVAGFAVLPILAPEAEYVRFLPPIHKDPFDRLIIAQALLSGRTIVTRDAAFIRYAGVQLFA